MLQEKSLGELIVVSEGPGVDWLAAQAAAENIRTLRRLGFNHSRCCPMSGEARRLGGNPRARRRRVLRAVESAELSLRGPAGAARGAERKPRFADRRRAGAGLVVEPTDVAGFCAAACDWPSRRQLREKAGPRGPPYAETHFDIERITDRFEQILSGRS